MHNDSQVKHQNTQSSLAIMQADIEQALRLKKDTARSFTSTQSDTDTSTLAPTYETDSAMLSVVQISRVIEMAWEDRTPFSAIEHSYGLNESAVIALMRQQLKPSSFRLWRARVSGRATKHEAKRSFIVGRAYCKTQYKPR